MRLNNYFITVLVIIFFILPFKNSYSKDFIVSDAIDPYCDGIDVDAFLLEKKVSNIEIKPDNPRRWLRNAFRAIVEFNSDEYKTDDSQWFTFRISNNFKKNFNSDLFVNFKEKNLSCKFRAKIRMTGDLWWHLDWKKGTPLTSLQVNLLDGHINSITRFKLFIPKSRGSGNNEVFISTFLRELGFLAPRSFMVPFKINGVTEDYIFQEDLRKEFLENFNLVEGPLLEGDERFTIMLSDEKMLPALSLSRIINKNYSLKSDTNRRTALSAVSNLNLLYLQHHQTEPLSESRYLPIDKLHINTKNFFLDKLNKEKFQTYEALIYALDAYHSLSYDDRRFYFDPIKKNFLPIYYDGKSNIFDSIQKSKIESLSNRVSIDAKKGAIKAIKLIERIDHENLLKKLTRAGVNVTSNEYKDLIKKIITRLKTIGDSNPLSVKFLDSSKYFSNLKKNETKDKKLIFVNFDKKQFYICDFDLNNCETKENNDLEFKNSLAEILSQRFVGINNSQYLFVYDDLNYEKGKYSTSQIWENNNFNNEFNIKHNKDISLQVNQEKKEIIIKQMSNKGRVVITGNLIEDWNIVFNGNYKKNDPYILNDYMNLTGCLTLLDLEVKNINIVAKNSNCEDSINFIRVKGEVESINITESMSDGLDLDFSEVKINYVQISYSGNDCLDLSSGKYSVNNIMVKNCGDKGISIGEKSNVKLKEIKVDQTNIGLAAKDSSIVEIDNSLILKSPICFTAYRKKQEFSGAKIKVLNTNCDEKLFFTQKGSKINLGL